MFLFKLQTAVRVSIVWGLLLLSILSFKIAQDQKVKTWQVVLEHLIIAVIVILVANYVGYWISLTFT